MKRAANFKKIIFIIILLIFTSSPIKALNTLYENFSLLMIDTFKVSISANNKDSDTVFVFIGDTVSLKADIYDVLYYNGFNNQQNAAGWSSTGTLMFNNPCQCPFVGGQPSTNCPNGVPGQSAPLNTFAWLVSAGGLSSITTNLMGLPPTSGCKIKFWMMYGLTNETNPTTCEAPDQASEGVHFQYSTNNGMSWSDFSANNINPVGNLSTIPPYKTITPGSGGYWNPVFDANQRLQNTLYFWNKYENTIPSNILPNIQFKWGQYTNTGNGWDNWGIDEIEVTCNHNPTYNVSWVYNGIQGPANIVNPPSFVLSQFGYYNYTVYVTDTITGLTRNDNIVVCALPKPDTAGTISGATSLCYFINSTYTVPPIANATSYIWTLPSGISGSSSTNSITCGNIYNTLPQPGFITVRGHNSAGDGIPSSLYINIIPNTIGTAGVISGLDTVCQGQTNVVYTVPVIDNVQSYMWSLNSINYTTSTNQLIINIPDSTHSPSVISVKGKNVCSISIYSNISTKNLFVKPLPKSLTPIYGLDTICKGQTATYSTNYINTNYFTWNLPIGSAGTSISNFIVVNFDTNFNSGYIYTKGVNSCGSKDIDSLYIIANPIPILINNVSGSDTVCQGQTSVVYNTKSSNATSYIWNLPNGANGISFIDSIMIDYDLNSQSGYIIAKGINSCGDFNTDSLFVYVVDIPDQVTISLHGDTLMSSSVIGNQWYELSIGAISGATSQYYIPQQNGDYTVLVTISGCEAEVPDLFDVGFIGTNEFLLKKLNLKVFPNPFSNTTKFTFTLIRKQSINLSIYDITGRLVKQLADENQNEGEHTLRFNAGNLQSGIYYYRLQAGDEVLAGKMILAK